MECHLFVARIQVIMDGDECCFSFYVSDPSSRSNGKLFFVQYISMHLEWREGGRTGKEGGGEMIG